ncbi:MAG: hypothetical protein IJK02_10615 [Clostridia bacterium]|nr:hypothetical protein [Clostridia bacterium]
MKTHFTNRFLSCLMAVVMVFTIFSAPALAAGNDGNGKYLKDVYIAYGETKEEAESWMRDNGWEPFADLNEGKTSNAPGFANAVAVLGIKRTNDPGEAITDMAAMNMNGGYSFDDYEALVAQKKTDITEFINTFVPALNEYRDNYNSKGSEGGKKRAQQAHDILNKFYDGDPNGEYAVNDTGKPLGDLLLNKTKTEIGDDAYNALSAEQKLNTADLQQIILESSGPAVQSIEQALALATDTAETSWLDRLNGLSGEGLVERIAEFAPETAGQDLAPSAALSLLAAAFEDYAKVLAAEWIDVHEDILWYETYCAENALLPEDGEDDEAFSARFENYFNDLKENDEDRYLSESNRFTRVSSYYDKIWEIEYAGDWGTTLYDFFCPEDENAYYGDKYEYFAPLAAVLSDGQRAALEFLSLSTLLKLGMNNDDAMETDFPSVDSLFKDEKDKALGSISIYSGINRAIFRKGVALTSKALQEKAMGRDPYDLLWDEKGLFNIMSYTLFVSSAVFLVGGAASAIYGAVANLNAQLAEAATEGNLLRQGINPQTSAEYIRLTNKTQTFASMNVAGKWVFGVGAALMIIAAVLKGVQLHYYYNRTFSKIPVMIVDEADIVSYTTDDAGRQVQNINFDQFAYYEVVKCNRQIIGVNSDAQGGVSDYKEWGCGDAADINADVGKQWLAMYVNRSAAKGDPILADSLRLEKGTASHPEGYAKWLHMFGAPNVLKIDDEQYCYRSDNNGMYLYWQGDENAFEDTDATATAFNAGYFALSGVGGLALGIAGTALVTGRKKKEREEPAA